MGEEPVSWQTWSDGVSSVPIIIGDQDWGQLELECEEEGRSDVYDFGSIYPRVITIGQNRYQDGQNYATLQFRVSNVLFLQNDVLPAWEYYTEPHNTNDRYIQIRFIKEP